MPHPSSHAHPSVHSDTPGVEIIRPLAVFGHEHDHAEIIFNSVRVPASYLLTQEGRGFEIAQGRLGPGRLHHCMRTLGQAETGLGAMMHRIKTRSAFGGLLVEKAQIVERIAEFRVELTAARQLCYLAASVADEKGWKAAKPYVSMIKVMAPRVALKILDEAMQVHGAHGISQARWAGFPLRRGAEVKWLFVNVRCRDDGNGINGSGDVIGVFSGGGVCSRARWRTGGVGSRDGSESADLSAVSDKLLPSSVLTRLLGLQAE